MRTYLKSWMHHVPFHLRSSFRHGAPFAEHSLDISAYGESMPTRRIVEWVHPTIELRSEACSTSNAACALGPDSSRIHHFWSGSKLLEDVPNTVNMTGKMVDYPIDPSHLVRSFIRKHISPSRFQAFFSHSYLFLEEVYPKSHQVSLASC